MTAIENVKGIITAPEATFKNIVGRLFSLELSYKEPLKTEKVDEQLIEAFKKNNISLSSYARISTINEKKWGINDGLNAYRIEETDKQLDVYKKGDHRLIIPLDILIAIGIIKGIVDFLQRPRILEVFSSLSSTMTSDGLTGFQNQVFSEAASIQNVTIFDAISSAVIQAIFGWLFLVLIYYIISRILSGKANLKELLEVVGYARVPELIGASVALLFTSISPFFIIFLMLIFSLWARVLDIFAIKEANDFSTTKATAVVFVPIALYILFVIFTVLMVLGI